ncbi:MAG: hypothetical protein LBV15_06270 [Planctomycetota bacterium]|jgi:hypothetical protein|nr:hypothetical protein [Planctomycetota bacterium]
MRRILYGLAAALALAALSPAGDYGPRTMSGWFGVTTPSGWQGRRYMDGGEIFAEEFDSNGDGRLDVWRFYRRGVLSSEERDLNADGRVDCVSRWDPRSHRLLYFARDTRHRGTNDLEIEAAGDRRWEIREDRNLDGITDRILFIQGPNNLFEVLGLDLALQEDVTSAIPAEYWRELWSDDAFTSVITDYRRYSRGQLSQYGELDGDAVRWRRAGPNFAPPAAQTASGPPPAGPASGSARISSAPSEAGAATAPPSPPETYRPESDTGSQGDSGYVVSPPVPEADPGEASRPSFSDRTRYEDLPPGESAARSLPAPMRPPGVGRR